MGVYEERGKGEEEDVRAQKCKCLKELDFIFSRTFLSLAGPSRQSDLDCSGNNSFRDTKGGPQYFR